MLEARAASRATPIFTSRGALNDLNCRLTMPVVKGCGARDLLLEITKIWVFKCSKRNSATLKHLYRGSANCIESYSIVFHINRLLDRTAPAINIEGIISRAHLRYTLDPGRLIKPVFMVKLMSFPIKIHTIVS